MARSPVRPPALRGKLFRGSAAVRSGQLTRAQLRSSAWRRLFPDVYACASLPVTHHLRAVAAAGILLPGAVLCGRSAATAWGVPLAGADDDVELAVLPSCRAGAARGVRATRRSLPAQEVTSRHGLSVTTPVQTALDLGRIAPIDEAVVALDQFLCEGPVPLETLRAAATATSAPGCRHVRRAVGLADGLAESPQETRLRLVLGRSRLPAPVAQFVVRDAGGFVARVDFAWPAHRLALEYEGAWHGQGHQVAKDRRRLNKLAAAEWRVLFVTAEDLRHPEELLARIAAALVARAYV